MATDLKSHAQGVSLTRFAGGTERGSCVQVTMRKRELPATADSMSLQTATADNFFDSLQLTRAQAAALAADLMDFAQGREVEDIE